MRWIPRGECMYILNKKLKKRAAGSLWIPHCVWLFPFWGDTFSIAFQSDTVKYSYNLFISDLEPSSPWPLANFFIFLCKYWTSSADELVIGLITLYTNGLEFDLHSDRCPYKVTSSLNKLLPDNLTVGEIVLVLGSSEIM